MKLITYRYQNQTFVGALSEGGISPLPYGSMNELIESGETPVPGAPTLRAEDAELLAPIPRPRQDVICLGVNYQSHAEETGSTFTGEGAPVPIFFSKRVNEAAAPGGVIQSHFDIDSDLDYEAELAVIIGRSASRVSEEEAGSFVFGYTVLNDVSSRRLQTHHKQWYFGKSLDGATPMGPWIVTADEIAFPPALDIRCRVNGELRQHANTSQLMTTIPQIIHILSAGMTLLPGTIISTGTPSGVGLGFQPPRYLKSGDVVECEIERIGVLRSTVR